MVSITVKVKGSARSVRIYLECTTLACTEMRYVPVLDPVVSVADALPSALVVVSKVS